MILTRDPRVMQRQRQGLALLGPPQHIGIDSANAMYGGECGDDGDVAHPWRAMRIWSEIG